jgi:hypothetical protein
MRQPMHLALIVSAVFLLTYTTAYGQIPPNGLYCASGLHPDAYIDFSGLPAAPALPGNSPSAPVTATLPVIGVPGLTVTIRGHLKKGKFMYAKECRRGFWGFGGV